MITDIDYTLPLYLQVEERSPYIEQILKKYPGWRDWEIAAYAGGGARDVDGWIYVLYNQSRTFFKIGFSEKPKERISQVKSSIQHLPASMDNSRQLWSEKVIKRAHMYEEAGMHKLWKHQRVEGLSAKVQGRKEWYPSGTAAAEWVKSNLNKTAPTPCTIKSWEQKNLFA